MSLRARIVPPIKSVLGPERSARVRQIEMAFRGQLPATPAQPAGRGKRPKQPRLTRAEMIEALGRTGVEGLGAGSTPPEGLRWVTLGPQEPHERFDITRHSFLQTFHQLLQPRTYFEIGVDRGQSLTLSRTKSIGVDPSYTITREIHCDVQTFLQTSDDFFATPGNFAHFGGVPVDLAFIDGMHLAEYALRDFANIERHMSPGGVVILDDVMPRNSLESYRVRRTRESWTGDVFKVHEVLQKYRPDLTLIPLNTEPTGSYLIVGLDPQSTVLHDAYDDFKDFLESPDPQNVELSWLRREDAHDPHRIIASDIWPQVRELRERDAERAEYAALWRRLAGLPDGA